MSNFRMLYLACCASILGAPTASASTGGMTNSAGVCGACHGGAGTNDVSVQLEGPSTLAIDQEAAYVVRIQGGPLVAAGFNLRVRPWGAATLISGEGSRLELNELTHSAPRTAVNGAVVFAFRLKAGSVPATLTLLAVGNSVNLSNTPQGDLWNNASWSVKVEAAPPELDAGLPAEPPDAGQPSAHEQQSTGCSATGGAVGLVAVPALARWWKRRFNQRRR